MFVDAQHLGGTAGPEYGFKMFLWCCWTSADPNILLGCRLDLNFSLRLFKY